MKIKPTDLKLGDTLEDGSRVISRSNGALILARKVDQGWARETRFVFGWSSGDERDVMVLSRLQECSTCGEGSNEVTHEFCKFSDNRQTLDQAVDIFLSLGAELVTPAAVGDFGPWNPALSNVDFVVFDTETTGLHRVDDRVIELAAIRLNVSGEKSRFETLVNPGFPIPEGASAINHIYDEDVSGAPDEESVLSEFATFCKGAVLVAHNAPFDISFISNGADRHGIEFEVSSALDTLEMSRGKAGKPGSALVPRSKTENYKLITLAKTLGIPHHNAHRAMGDVEATVGLLDWLLREKYRRQTAVVH